MRRFLRTFPIVASILLLPNSVAWAQATAELNGRVADVSGAVLPGVTVTATQIDTGFTRTVVTDGTGSYVMPNLPTGPYKLEVSLQGFKSYVQTGIVLQVGATPTVNATLAVGNLEETVTVEAAAPIVDVRSAGIKDVVENERIVELPLQGRQVTDLIILAGGAVDMGRPNARHFQSGTQISVAGGVTFGMSYTLDGAMHNDVQNADGLPLPFPDALQEFSVATSGLGAQAGMQSGASVNAVTKSGTNRYSGVAFEFLRDKRFNAKSVFAAIGPDGKKKDDGLKRNQFGGTLGGPIVKDKLFFFGAYQGTPTRVLPTDNIAFVPTAAMLAGDFTAFASPACNGGRQVNLTGGIVNNRIDPARFSPASVKLAGLLPKTDNPCGETRLALPADRDEYQVVSRVDYQLSTSQSVFGRYMATSDKRPSGYSMSGGNPLTTTVPYTDNLAQSATFGNTRVIGTNLVNATRFAYNRTVVDTHNDPFFGPAELGIKIYTYTPPPAKETVINVTGGFDIGSVNGTTAALNNAYQVSDDLTLVRGNHQLGIGANAAYWNTAQSASSRNNGTFAFNGQATGLGLSDFLMGRTSAFVHGNKTGVAMNQMYWGLYAQDAWRATSRVTVNAGARWEPFTGQNIIDGAVPNFSIDKFRQGVKSTVFTKAPAGFSYAGDPGFNGKTGFASQWWNISPRVGVAWDVTGDGRMAVRSSYELGYSMPTGGVWFIMASAPPYGNRTQVSDPTGLWDDPYRDLGGDPHPIVVGPNTPYPPSGQLGAISPNIRAPRLQSWNVTLERQIGAAWGVSASYLGSYSDRLWNTRPLNPGVFLGLGPCAINGVNYPVCSTNANLNARRALSLEKATEGQYISNLDEFTDAATQNYRALKLTFRRRAPSGVSLNGNYTLGRCFGLESAAGGAAGFGAGYTKPDDPDFDRGHCSSDRTHIANFTVGYQTPRFGNPALRTLASDWRVSGIVSARSGSWLTVTTGRDTALNGQANQRVNQISDDVYGAKTLNSYLNRAAFAEPAPGGFGNYVVNSIKGPGFWKADLALSRLFSFTTTQNIEIRLEAFNLFNRFNWGNPTTSLASATFGRIQSAAGDPRIIQFGVKYGF